MTSGFQFTRMILTPCQTDSVQPHVLPCCSAIQISAGRRLAFTALSRLSWGGGGRGLSPSGTVFLKNCTKTREVGESLERGMLGCAAGGAGVGQGWGYTGMAHGTTRSHTSPPAVCTTKAAARQTPVSRGP